MTIIEFFDPYNIEHLKAFKYLMDTEIWPIDFYEEIPDNIEFPVNWKIILAGEMAYCWVNACLDGTLTETLIDRTDYPLTV